jgi:hypothetical protein
MIVVIGGADYIGFHIMKKSTFLEIYPGIALDIYIQHVVYKLRQALYVAFYFSILEQSPRYFHELYR